MAAVPNLRLSQCAHCNRHGFWLGSVLVHPPSLVPPAPHDDLAEPALSSYNEARAVFAHSPRAAAALLRLSLQQLVGQLGAKSTDLNTAVGELVKYGLPPQIQQSMDAVRLVGNEAVHPGQIDLNDKMELALGMFSLVNLTVDAMITQPRMVGQLYSQLPQTKLDAIDKRDGVT